MMNRKSTLPAFALAMLVGFSGCDLDVQNPNQADRERALASPDDVETLIASAFQQYWGVTHYWFSNGPALNHMSSRHSATWGNYGMDDLGREPREPLPNQVSFPYAYVFEQPWQDNYGGISAASDGLRAIEAGLEIGPGGERNPRARAFGQFVQALSTCNLALTFDQGFLLDETTDVSGELETVPYDQMMTEALAKFDEAIAQARGNPFTLPDGWINGNPLTNNEFADMMVAYKARCRANVARSEAEAATIDWAAVGNDAASGLTELIVVGNEAFADAWWDGIKTLGGTENNTWHRQHMDWVGMADVTGEYQDWLSTPLQNRTARQISTPDLRYPRNNVDGEEGLLHRYNATIIFRAERGTYRQSHYGDFRYDTYLNSCSQCYFGDIVELLPREFRLYEAEAAFRTGDVATTVAILNETRVPRGGLPALVDGGTVPGGTDCVPRKRYDPTGTCGDLRDALIWEHFEEVYAVSAGLEYYHGRRFDILPAGTALHFPIPAADLEVLQRDIYTFGGDPGAPGSAPVPTPSVVAGDIDATLERAAYSLARLQERQKARTQRALSNLVIR